MRPRSRQSARHRHLGEAPPPSETSCWRSPPISWTRKSPLRLPRESTGSGSPLAATSLTTQMRTGRGRAPSRPDQQIFSPGRLNDNVAVRRASSTRPPAIAGVGRIAQPLLSLWRTLPKRPGIRRAASPALMQPGAHVSAFRGAGRDARRRRRRLGCARPRQRPVCRPRMGPPRSSAA